MSEPTDGGPAFPGGDGINSNTGPYSGMTLRDYFASQVRKEEVDEHLPTTRSECIAFMGLPATTSWTMSHYMALTQTIKYRIADAMLAARTKGTAT